ncbi:unnamed protein product [Prorocentrum cordatum]|uniref:Mediator of RNA polymerase II transcription subunit 4 n=1 Tax=Prorocentrum cordatum TaxID=2364126 RepID=A0ABN9RQN4_9DINO|nr:unnamed protein product [Polarella glacialis]
MQIEPGPASASTPGSGSVRTATSSAPAIPQVIAELQMGQMQLTAQMAQFTQALATIQISLTSISTAASAIASASGSSQKNSPASARAAVEAAHRVPTSQQQQAAQAAHAGSLSPDHLPDLTDAELKACRALSGQQRSSPPAWQVAAGTMPGQVKLFDAFKQQQKGTTRPPEEPAEEDQPPHKFNMVDIIEETNAAGSNAEAGFTSPTAAA